MHIAKKVAMDARKYAIVQSIHFYFVIYIGVYELIFDNDINY